MVEIINRNVEHIEKIEVNKNPKLEKLITRLSSAKSPLNFAKAQLQLIKNSKIDLKNFELVLVWQDLIKRLEEYAQTDRKNADFIKLDILDGYKGKDLLSIYKGITNDFIVISHNKNKENGEITQTQHIIKHEDLNRVIFYIKSWQVGESHKCYDFAEVLGFSEWKDLWRERKIYFATYYFPLKILEKLEVIKYSGRGEVTRLL